MKQRPVNLWHRPATSSYMHAFIHLRYAFNVPVPVTIVLLEPNRDVMKSHVSPYPTKKDRQESIYVEGVYLLVENTR